jgi:hypothetical protein
MYRALGAAALLAIATVAAVQDAAAQDPARDALLGAAIGAIIGGASGAAIASQGEARPGGYRFYQEGCYRRRRNGGWVIVAPEYCGEPVAAPAEFDPQAPPPPPVAVMRDELRDRMFELRGGCDAGDRRACVQLGIIIGENRARRDAWRRDYPDIFSYERY